MWSFPRALREEGAREHQIESGGDEMGAPEMEDGKLKARQKLVKSWPSLKQKLWDPMDSADSFTFTDHGPHYSFVVWAVGLKPKYFKCFTNLFLFFLGYWRKYENFKNSIWFFLFLCKRKNSPLPFFSFPFRASLKALKRGLSLSGFPRSFKTFPQAFKTRAFPFGLPSRL